MSSKPSSIPATDYLSRAPLPADPWSDLFPESSLITPFLLETMLRLIAYDVADPKRLRRVAEACEDYGVRVQKSLFECWLEEPRFEELWSRLQEEIDPEKDALAAYVLDRGCVHRRRVAGQGMILSLPRSSYVL